MSNEKNKKKSNKGKAGNSQTVDKENMEETQEMIEQEEGSVNDEKIIDFHEEKARMESQSSELESALKELEELKTTVQRTQADFINYKRRTEEEREKIAVFANEKIIMELLSVLDNFDRALAHHGDTEQSFVEGVELIKKQIVDLLEKNGVKEIENDILFDPNFHYAVMQEEGEENGKILEVFQKGYLLGSKVIRPSMVKVSK